MGDLTIEVGSFPVPFKSVFKHTTASRAATENLVVRVSDDDGNVGYGEGCPRSYVTGETEVGAKQAISGLVSDASTVTGIGGLRQLVDQYEKFIDTNPAAFCALELAILDLLARREGRTIESLLGLDPLQDAFAYSAVLGDCGPVAFAAQVLRYRAAGLRHYKLKISGGFARDRAKLRWFKGFVGKRIGSTVRVDANNLWNGAHTAVDHLAALDYDFLGIEEPLQANDLTGFLEVAEGLDTPIILDESLLRLGQLSELPGPPARWILNCRISKSGGLLRSLDLISAAKKRGLGVIVGAHVGETSLLTRAALTAASVAGDALLAQEGAFGTFLLTGDLCEQPIMFGRGGQLDPVKQRWASAPGFGIDVIADRLVGIDRRRLPNDQ